MRRPRDTPAAGPAVRATRTFVGRDAELARILDHVEREPVFVICGVAGIGKTELAIRAAEELAAQPAWRAARHIAIGLQPGMDRAHVVARLRDGVQLGRHAAAASADAGLAAVVTALTAARAIVRIDDLHVLADADAGWLLGYLARHLRTSCVLATSRRELPVPPPAPPAWVVRVQPLAPTDARRLVELLTERLGLAPFDPGEVVDRAGGSPFYLQHELAARHLGHPPHADALGQSLAQLDAEARRLLIRLATVATPTARAAVLGHPADAAALEVLARRFLADAADGQVRMHDVVRAAALRLATSAERRDAHRWAAGVHARAAASARPGALHALEAIRHLQAAGAHGEAVVAVMAYQRAIAQAGLDHLLLAPMAALRGHHPERAFAIDLVCAHVYLRQSQVDAARAVLAPYAADPVARQTPAFHGLVAMAALRTGELAAVAAALDTALALPGPAPQRRRLILGRADLHAVRGEADLARRLLGPAEVAGGAVTASERMRWRRSQLIALIFDQAFAAAVAAAAAHRAAGLDGPADLEVQLAMLEVVALVELGEATAAATLVARVIAPAARRGALREVAAGFYGGLAAWATGDLAAARAGLTSVHRYLTEHGDAIFGGVVGHYLGRVLLDSDQPAEAEALLRATTLRAEQMGIGLAPLGWAYVARAQLAQGLLDAAAATLAPVLEGGLAGPAHGVAWQVAAELAAARGEPTACAQALAQVRAAGGPDARLGPGLDLAVAEAELGLREHGPAALAAAAHAALDHHARRGARRGEAHAAVRVAAAHVMLGRRGDRVLAGAALARARALVATHGYRGLATWCALLDAALAQDRAEAEGYLAAALAARYADAPTDARLLQAALDGEPGPGLRADDVARLTALGLLRPPPARSELVVDLTTSTISTAAGAAVRGRALLCELLVQLAEAEGQPLDAARLYCAAWHSRDYHPLRHRNTLYAGVNRLRQVLATLLPERGPLITTVRDGWSLRTEAVHTRIVRAPPR
ncbi:MAG: hypothetical protein R3B06_02360 [Kofleriaceae bacterium]